MVNVLFIVGECYCPLYFVDNLSPLCIGVQLKCPFYIGGDCTCPIYIGDQWNFPFISVFKYTIHPLFQWSLWMLTLEFVLPSFCLCHQIWHFHTRLWDWKPGQKEVNCRSHTPVTEFWMITETSQTNVRCQHKPKARAFILVVTGNTLFTLLISKCPLYNGNQSKCYLSIEDQ